MRIGPVTAVTVKAARSQRVGLPCRGEGAAPLQSLAMIGICEARPLRLATTMITPGIQSPPASTVTPKMSAARQPHGQERRPPHSPVEILLGSHGTPPRGSPLTVAAGERATIRRNPRQRSAQPCRAHGTPGVLLRAQQCRPSERRATCHLPAPTRGREGATQARPLLIESHCSGRRSLPSDRNNCDPNPNAPYVFTPVLGLRLQATTSRG